MRVHARWCRAWAKGCTSKRSFSDTSSSEEDAIKLRFAARRSLGARAQVCIYNIYLSIRIDVWNDDGATPAVKSPVPCEHGG